jgi:hypothetical protein
VCVHLYAVCIADLHVRGETFGRIVIINLRIIIKWVKYF